MICPHAECDLEFTDWALFVQHLGTHEVLRCPRPDDHEERLFVDGYCCHCGGLHSLIAPHDCSHCNNEGVIETKAAGAGYEDDLAEYQWCPYCNHGRGVKP
jgi:hypothetical protein